MYKVNIAGLKNTHGTTLKILFHLPWQRILHCWQAEPDVGLDQEGARPPCVEDRNSDDRSPTAFGPSFLLASGRPTSKRNSPGHIRAEHRKQTSHTPVKMNIVYGSDYYIFKTVIFLEIRCLLHMVGRGRFAMAQH